MRIETKLEKVKEALIKNDDIEDIEIEPKDHPFLTSWVKIKYKSGLFKMFPFNYNSSPTEYIKAYNNYMARKEVEKNERN